MSVSQLRAGGLLLVACLFTWGCPDGQSLYVPPQATAAPGESRIVVYAAEGRTPDIGTRGGAVSAYRLGEDGRLEGGPPLSSVPVVNPRQLLVHPALPVLYVATNVQILAFDISNEVLISLCGSPGVGLAPPCATSPRTGTTSFDMTIAQNVDGTYTLYSAENPYGGSGSLSRIAAFTLGENGELPGFATSQGLSSSAFRYEGVAASPIFLWASDTSVSRLYRFDREADGSLPFPAPTPRPAGEPTPTPSPSPAPTPEDGPSPTPSPIPSPTPVFFTITNPGRIAVTDFPDPSPGGDLGTLYAVKKRARRMASFPVDEFYDLPDGAVSESPSRGDYIALLVPPGRNRLYGVLFEDGMITSYALDENGNIESDEESTTLGNPASYPTGIAWLAYTPPGGEPEQILFVSQGGLDRIDGYRVGKDGGISSKPFTSTQPRFDTFPTDVAVAVLPPR